MDALNFEDDKDRLAKPDQEAKSPQHPFNEAALILGRLQQSLRLLSRDSNDDSLRKALSNMGNEASSLGRLFSDKGLTLLSKLCQAVDKLAKDLSQEEKIVDQSAIRTFSHALDCLRGYSTDKVSRASSQRLPIHVLALDDDPVCRKVLQRALGAEHMNVVLCETAENALNCLEAFRFDVVLSDILMPEVDGFEFIKRLRRVEMHANTPVIFITALNDTLTRSRSRLTGGCEFISKPINSSELVIKVLGFAWKSRLLRGADKVETAGDLLPTTQPKPSAGSPQGGERPSQTVGVLSIGADGLIRSVSRDGATILGCSGDELPGLGVARCFVEPADSGQPNELTPERLARLADASTPTRVLVRLPRGSKAQALQIRVSRSGSGASAVFVCLFTAVPAERSGNETPKAR